MVNGVWGFPHTCQDQLSGSWAVLFENLPKIVWNGRRRRTFTVTFSPIVVWHVWGRSCDAIVSKQEIMVAFLEARVLFGRIYICSATWMSCGTGAFLLLTRSCFSLDDARKIALRLPFFRTRRDSAKIVAFCKCPEKFFSLFGKILFVYLLIDEALRKTSTAMPGTVKNYLYVQRSFLHKWRCSIHSKILHVLVAVRSLENLIRLVRLIHLGCK